MKKIICVLFAVVMALMALSGCGRSHEKEIEELLAEVETKINTIFVDASAMYDKGTIDSELYLQITDVRSDYIDAKNLFETTDGEQDEEIIESLKQCSENLDQLQESIDAIKEAEDVVITVNELEDIAESLKPYMEAGLSNGYLDQARLDEFNQLAARLDEIAANPVESDEITQELADIRETFAVMASQCAAPNDIVDLITNSEAAQNNAVQEGSIEESTAQAVTEAAKPLSNNMTALIDSYTELQNEASQKFDKGEIDESSYMTLIQAGTNLAMLKEEMEKNGESDSLNARIEDCKKQIKSIAESMNSELASKF